MFPGFLLIHHYCSDAGFMPDVPQAIDGKISTATQIACLLVVAIDNVLNLKDKMSYSLDQGGIWTLAAGTPALSIRVILRRY